MCIATTGQTTLWDDHVLRQPTIIVRLYVLVCRALALVDFQKSGVSIPASADCDRAFNNKRSSSIQPHGLQAAQLLVVASAK